MVATAQVVRDGTSRDAGGRAVGTDGAGRHDRDEGRGFRQGDQRETALEESSLSAVGAPEHQHLRRYSGLTMASGQLRLRQFLD
jgi:hypothetical protein